MGYVQANLMPNEAILARAKPSLSISVLFVHILLMFVYGIGFITILFPIVRHLTSEMAITNKRFVAKSGFLSRKVVEIPLQQIESIEVTQGFIERLDKAGSICVQGTGGKAETFKRIRYPMEFKKAYQGLLYSSNS